MHRPAFLAILLCACGTSGPNGKADAALVYDTTAAPQMPWASTVEVRLWSGHTQATCFQFSEHGPTVTLDGRPLAMAMDAQPGWGGAIYDPVTGRQDPTWTVEECNPAFYALQKGTLPDPAGASTRVEFKTSSEEASFETSNVFRTPVLSVREPSSGRVRRGDTAVLAISPAFSDVGDPQIISAGCGSWRVAATVEAGTGESLVRVTIPADLPSGCDGPLQVSTGMDLKPSVLNCTGLGKCSATLRTAAASAILTLGQ